MVLMLMMFVVLCVQLGKINERDLLAVRNISGHTGQIAADYYVMDERKKDVDGGRRVLAAAGLGEEFIDEWSNLEPEPMLHKVWGRDHPAYDRKNVRKVPWSPAEIKYIGDKVTMLNALPNPPVNMMSHCLKLINEDAVAQDIFHQHHVLNSARMRPGYDAYRRTLA